MSIKDLEDSRLTLVGVGMGRKIRSQKMGGARS